MADAQGPGGGQPTDTLTAVESPRAGERRAGPAEREDAFAPGATLGRFIVLHAAGEGGMGVVYAAYDPALDRKVAVKLLQPSRAETDREVYEARLRREAQALAKLTHPNVLTVYDAGLVGDRLFLAMEYVAGSTLADWLERERRSGREILRVFRLAGRGLAAAHSAGIVHRDFKPANVLVGDDGRVVVADFGLARAVDQPERGEAEVVLLGALEEGRGLANRDLTRAGVRMGTPAYMAPEQLEGGPVGPAADQYSFCVALRQALAATGAALPGRLRRALERGTAALPDARFASMERLLAALEMQPWTGRGRLAAAGLAVGLATAALAVTVASRPPPCKGAADSLRGVWDAPRQSAIEQAFRATGAPFAAAAWTGTRAALDRYAGEWVAMRTEACLATRVRGEQSEELMDRRMACLDQRLAEMEAFGSLLAKADRELTARATEAAEGLPPLAACADTAALTAPFREPKDAASQAKMQAVRRDLAAAKAAERAGRYAQGLEAAGRAGRSAEALGYWPLTAEALLQRGVLEERQAQPAEAAATLNQALLAAEAGRHDRVAVEAFIRLVRVEGFQLAHPVEGHRFARLARGLLPHLDRRDELEATLADHEGTVLLQEGRYPAALARHRKALALRQATAPGDRIEAAKTLSRIGHVQVQMGELEAALGSYRRALSINEQLLGPYHPSVAKSLDDVGTVLYRTQRHAEALAAHRRALDIGERSFGPDHRQIAATLTNLGSVYSALGDEEAALAHHRRAVAIYEAALGPDHPNVAFPLSNEAAALMDLGRLDEAASSLARALRIQQIAYGKDHPWVATTVCNLGEVERRRGKARQAAALYRRALAIWGGSGEPDPVLVGYGLSGLGQSLLSLGETEPAAGFLERALAVLAARPVDPMQRAEAQFALARVLAALGRDRPRALELARQARAGYASAGRKGQRHLTEVDAWLGRLPAAP